MNNFEFSVKSAEIINQELNFLKNTMGWKLMMEWVEAQMKELSEDVMLRVDAESNKVAYTAYDVKKVRYNEMNSLKKLPETIMEIANRAAISYGERGAASIPTNILPKDISSGISSMVASYGGQPRKDDEPTAN